MLRRVQWLSLILLVFLLVGCLSDGKFYVFSVPPNTAYSDHGVSPIGLTAGTKLTDVKIANDPWDFWSAEQQDRFVGWDAGDPVNITIDLGRVHRINRFDVGAASLPTYGIYFPSSVQILTSKTNSNPSSGNNDFSTTLPAFPSDCTSCTASAADRHTSSLSIPTSTVVEARYIKFRVHRHANVPGDFIFLDEVVVDGIIENPQRFVPSAGTAYHGAFAILPNGVGEQYGLNIPYFEALVGKSLATYLWYQTIGDSYLPIQQIISSHPTKGLILGVAPSVPAPPGGTVLDAINDGSYDQEIAAWFAAAAQQLGTGVGQINLPLFLRLGAEMNTDWTPWGGPLNNDPGKTNGPEKFIAMWRRVYNIAQKQGATNTGTQPNEARGNTVFAWSPKDISYPSGPTFEWNAPAKYYPGDQYVEWVGINHYSGLGAQGAEPEDLIRPIYNLYTARKPMMFGENGACIDVDPPVGDGVGGSTADKAVALNHLFTQLPQFPRLQAITYFNQADGLCDWRLDTPDTMPLTEYRAQITNSRYTSTIQGQ